MKTFLCCCLFALFILISCGCDQPQEMGFTPSFQETTQPLMRTEGGQMLAYVGFTELAAWLGNHKKVKLVQIAPISRNNNGSTNGFLILYEER